MNPESTRLAYLRNSLSMSGTALLMSTRPGSDGTASLVLDSTLFYPQGGGQPCDTGEIQLAAHPNTVFRVTSVKLVEHREENKRKQRLCFPVDVVEHQIDGPTGELASLSLPLPVNMSIDKNRRVLNSRIHTAGHLLDIVLMDIMGLPLTVCKAYHFPAGPHIVYHGLVSFSDDTEQKGMQLSYSRKGFLETVEENCNRLIASNLNTFIEHASPDDDYAMRWMSIESFPRKIPCGGTHVSSLGDLGPRMRIRKVQVKTAEQQVKVGYQLE